MDRDYKTDRDFEKSSPFVPAVKALLKGETVFIPTLGYLSVFFISGRKTVLFKTLTGKESENTVQDLFDMDALVTQPLREGTTVNIPELGNFRPIRNSNGSLRVAYTVSPALRNMLNDIESVPSPPKISPLLSDPSPLEKEEIPEQVEQETLQIVEEPEQPVSPKPKPHVIDSAPVPKKEEETGNSSVGKQIVEWSNRSRSKLEIPWDRIFNYVIVGGMAIVLLFFIYSKYFKKTDKIKRPVITRSEGIMTPLTELAEKNYGNSAFWVYIYESNREKLVSPINIPKGIDIIIPNLKDEYGVNPTDSADIRNAVLQGNIIIGLIAK
ncbi:MAG: hypothetical protein LBS54_01775 [Dysgonamonadaceae bacterium]|jgi:hypothetical protein|nr:hypothetical protein [Dysgonamonadaceae bacterium]